jgi:hypothetical protein
MANDAERWLAVGAAVVALLGFAGWRTTQSPAPAVAKPGAAPAAAGALVPAPSPQLRQLLAYAGPLADSVRVPTPPADTTVSVRDPFGPAAAARVTGGVSRPVTGSSADDSASGGDKPDPWKVTATLLVAPRAAAVINDVLIYVGDPVPGGGKLTSVERDRVTLTDPKGGSHTVAVREGDG